MMQNSDRSTSPLLPYEIIDKILIYVNDGFLAAQLDRIFILKEISRKKPDGRWAIEKGKLELLKQLVEDGEISGFPLSSKSLQTAAKSNYFKVLKFCNESIQSIKEFDLVPSAASDGHLSLVKYLQHVGCEATIAAMHQAAAHGHLDIILHLNSSGISPIETTINLAAENGHLHIVQYLTTLGCISTGLSVNGPAKNGHLEVVKYFYSLGIAPRPEALELAALNGHLETVKFLHSIGCPAGPDTLDYAARRGHLEIVVFLFGLGCKCRRDTMDRVAFAGHLEMLKYLEFIGCEFTNLGGRVKSPVAPLLAFMKNRDVFKYLYTKTKLDSTQREWVLFSAQEKGYKDLVQLIKKQA